MESEKLMWAATQESSRHFLADIRCQFAEHTLGHATQSLQHAVASVKRATAEAAQGPHKSAPAQGDATAMLAAHKSWEQASRTRKLEAAKTLHSLLIRQATLTRDTVWEELVPLAAAYNESLPLGAGVTEEELAELKAAVLDAEAEHRQASQKVGEVRPVLFTSVLLFTPFRTAWTVYPLTAWDIHPSHGVIYPNHITHTHIRAPRAPFSPLIVLCTTLLVPLFPAGACCSTAPRHNHNHLFWRLKFSASHATVVQSAVWKAGTRHCEGDRCQG